MKNHRIRVSGLISTIVVLALTASACGGAKDSTSRRSTRNAALTDSAFGFDTVRGGYNVYAGRRSLSCFDATHCAAIINTALPDNSARAIAYFGGGTTWALGTGGDFYPSGTSNVATTINCYGSDACTVIGTNVGPSGPAGDQGLGWHGFVSPSGPTTTSKSTGIVLPGDAAYNDSTLVHDSVCFADGKCAAVGKYHPASPTFGLDPRYQDQATPIVFDGTSATMTARRLTFPVAGQRYSLTRLECANQNFCVAVGTYEEADGARERVFVVSMINGTWNTKANVIPYPADATSFPYMKLSDVSCVPGGSCYVIGTYKAPYTSPNWSGINDYSYRVEITSTGDLGTVEKLPDSLIGQVISCPDKTNCVIYGVTAYTTKARELLLRSGVWDASSVAVAGTDVSTRRAPAQMRCTTISSCLIVYDSYMNIRTANGWTGQLAIPVSSQISADGLGAAFAPFSVVCLTQTICQVFGFASPQGADNPTGHHPSIATISLAKTVAAPTTTTTSTIATPTTAKASTTTTTAKSATTTTTVKTTTTTTVPVPAPLPEPVVPLDPTISSPNAPTSAASTEVAVSVNSTRTFAYVASLSGLKPAAGSKLRVTVATRSKAVCAVKKTSVVFTKAGTCSMSITATPRTGKAIKKSFTLTVK